MSLADQLTAARLAGKAVEIAEADFPKTEADVIAVQEEALRKGGLTAGGWKAGPPPAGMQDTGCAPLAAEWTVASGATVKAQGTPLLLESEFVLRFGKDVPPSAAPFTKDSIAGYIDALAPGIELVWRRCTNPGGDATALLYQADWNGHAGMVLGEWRTDWQSFDLSGHPVVQHVNGAVHAEGTSAKTMNGHPLNVAAALANREARLGRTIKAGCWVTTGSCTGALEIQPGDRVRSEYGDLGVVEVTTA
jgi:2-keto-4-pentenoate hydratase